MEGHMKLFFSIIEQVVHSGLIKDYNNEITWETLVQLAANHDLLPLFLEGAVQHPNYQQFLGREKATREAIVEVALQIQRTNAFLQLYKKFDDMNVYPLVMKGLICRELYGKYKEHRPSGDEDILIRIGDYQKVRDVLLSNGYITNEEPASEIQLEQLQEVSFFHPIDKLHIEVHLNAIGKENALRVKMNDCFKNVFENYREVTINGVNVRTMNHRDHLLFLILHAFKHFTFGGFGIRPMLDILMYQEHYGQEIDLQEIYNTLKTFNAHLFWNDLICIGNRWLGFKLDTFEQPNCPEQLLQDMMDCGTFGDVTESGLTASRTTLRALGNECSNQSHSFMSMIIKSIFPNRAYMVQQAPSLAEKPFLLPIYWIRRWLRFLIKQNPSNSSVESLKISHKRLELLKKYDIT